MRHPESEWSQTAQIQVDNSNSALTADLTGFTGIVSYGYKTSSDEYSATAPLECVGQQSVTSFRTGRLATTYSLAGVFDMMDKDEASADYSPPSTNTDTVKTILDAIAGATLACYSHCKAYTITYDTGYADSLINSFIPADYFRVAFKESRLTSFKKVLAWTRCKARIENTAGVATIHISLPKPYSTAWVANTVYAQNGRVTPTTANGFDYICTVPGTSHANTEPTWPTTEGATVADNDITWTIRWYDYEYNDAVTNHNFFEKSVRNRLVIPNRIYVSSHPDHSPPYTGNAVDAVSYAALGRYINQYHWLRVASNAQSTSIATAKLQKYQVGQERGSGYAPLNCGQEVMDYIKITDSAAGDTRTGNIGYLNRICEQGKFEFEFRFGDPELGGIGGLGLLSDDVKSIRTAVSQLIDAYNGQRDTIIAILDRMATMAELINRETVPKWHVTQQLIIPVI